MNRTRILMAYFYTGCHTALSACFLLLPLLLKSFDSDVYRKFLTLFTLVWLGYCWTILPLLYDKSPLISKKNITFEARFQLLNEKQGKIYSLMIMLFIFSSFLLSKFNLFSFLIFLHLAVLLFFYQLPKKFYSLRKIPYLKAFLISYIWAFLICLIAIMPENFNQLSQKNHIEVFLEIYFFILGLTLLFDFRDKDDDLSNNIKTFANTKLANGNMIKVLSIVSFALSFIFYDINLFINYLPFVALYLLVLVKLNSARKDLYYLAIVDSLMIAKGLNALQIHIM